MKLDGFIVTPLSKKETGLDKNIYLEFDNSDPLLLWVQKDDLDELTYEATPYWPDQLAGSFEKFFHYNKEILESHFQGLIGSWDLVEQVRRI